MHSCRPENTSMNILHCLRFHKGNLTTRVSQLNHQESKPHQQRLPSEATSPNWLQIPIQTLLLYQEIFQLLTANGTQHHHIYLEMGNQLVPHTPPLLSGCASSSPSWQNPIIITKMLGRDTHRDAEGRGGSRLHGGVLLGDPAGHAAPLPAPLRGGLCARDRKQRTVTNTAAEGQSRTISRPCRMCLLLLRCPCK